MGRTSDADERLMTAALDLMWEESYGAVTIDDICKRADVKRQLLLLLQFEVRTRHRGVGADVE